MKAEMFAIGRHGRQMRKHLDERIDELIQEFSIPVAEMVYWMTDMEVGSLQVRRAMLSWRIARAPWGAKLIQLAEIIDNGATIRIANPPFTADYLADKSLTLDRIAAVDAYEIMDLPLYRTARSMVVIGHPSLPRL